MSGDFVRDDKAYIGFLQRELIRSGIRLTTSKLMFVFVLWFLILALALFMGGVAVFVITLVGSLLFARAYLAVRFHRRLQKMISQLPQFLDHIIRSLKSGRTLGDGFLLAIENTQDPLQSALLRTRNSIQRGMPLTDAVNDFAQLYEREEFHMLALSIAVNQRYGGNASEVLKNLITLIRDRDLASRQLRALTGETRTSALVLGGLPVAMAGYLFISSPELLLGMWEQSTGQIVLLFAFGLQILGSLLLWRMMKSI
ncbi:MAG: type II secretion system F family protein [Pseudomonas sp.]|nr:type II secretion system F family protein [Pseudomonas sp.]